MSGRPLSIHQVKPLWSVPLTTSRSQAFNEPYIRRICSNRPNPAKPNLRASACAQSSRASSAADAWCDFARWSSLSALGHRAEAVLPHLALRASVLKATGAAIRPGIAISDIGLCGHCRCQCRTENSTPGHQPSPKGLDFRALTDSLTHVAESLNYHRPVIITDFDRTKHCRSHCLKND